MEPQSSSRITIQIPKLSSDDTANNNNQLHIQTHDPSAPPHIVPPDETVCSFPAVASSPGKFQLPEGWVVEKRRRRFDSFGGSPVFDKCYIEPGSERRSHSLLSVQRYITGGSESEAKPNLVKSPRHEKDNMQLVPSVYDDGSQLGLPSGWLVELRPRSDPSKIDKYYIEPDTRRRFRSLPDVHRYLKEEEGYVGTPMVIKSRHDRNNMQVVPTVYEDGSLLGLPSGWLVELRPRRDPSKLDKYYVEPWTGRRFRSIPDVQRYLNGEEEYTDNMQSVPSVFKSSSQFDLPCDWLVELRPRSDGTRSDKYYIEPGTGRKFRSVVAAQKHIKEAEIVTASIKSLMPMVYTTKDNVTGKVKKFKRLANVGKTSELTMKLHTSKETRAVTPSRPVTQIKWVFRGQGKNIWSPSIDDSPVPNSEVRQWSKAFVLSMDSQ